MRKKTQILAVLAGALFVLPMFGQTSPAKQDEERLEEAVCGLKEPVVFWIWSLAAGRPNPERLAERRDVEDIAFTTKDGRILRGYKLKATSREPPLAHRYLLVAQGNATLADQILPGFAAFAQSGYDVYIFDYRGYGRSEGKRRLKAIVSDYREIIGHLSSLRYTAERFYGMSFGGIVLLNALKFKPGEKRVVIDSTPSRLSNHGCPQSYDPVMNLPQNASTYFLIAGLKDHVVTSEESRELLDVAKARGASVLRDPQFNHPFMDKDVADHERRMAAVMAFLSD